MELELILNPFLFLLRVICLNKLEPTCYKMRTCVQSTIPRKDPQQDMKV